MDEVLEFDLPPEGRSSGRVRRSVATWLTDRGFPTGGLDDWLLVVSELVTNAAIHTGAEFRVVVRWNGERVMIEVFDAGGGVPVVLDEPPSVGGRGLFLVERLTSEWGYDPSSTGKRVWARTDVVAR